MIGLLFAYGVGIGLTGLTTDIKHLGLGFAYQKHVFISYTEVQHIWDVRGPQYKSSVNVSGSIGIKVAPESMYYEALWGLTYLGKTDSMLGGHFPQFKGTLGVGVEDEDGFIGVQYQHISSAGIHTPNRGRDLLGIKIGVKL